MEGDLDCLQFQCSELLALQAAYPESLRLNLRERHALQQACKLCGVDNLDQAVDDLHLNMQAFPDVHASEAGAIPELSGAIVIPEVKVEGAQLVMRFRLPAGYPLHATCHLSVECSASSAVYDTLQMCVTNVSGQEGECCLLTAVQDLKECAEQLLSQSTDAAANDGLATSSDVQGQTGNSQCDRSDALAQQVTMVRQLIWFHHIKNPMKRKTLVSEARDLRLGGASKPGFPGVVVVEGEADDVQEYTSRIRSLSWQAMQVRGCEQEACALPTQLMCQPGATQRQQREQLIDQLRKLPMPFVELPETGLSDMGAMCKDGGLEALFLTALKIA